MIVKDDNVSPTTWRFTESTQVQTSPENCRHFPGEHHCHIKLAYILKARIVTPTIPRKNLNFPQICPKMPQNCPKMTQNGPKWPKFDPKWP